MSHHAPPTVQSDELVPIWMDDLRALFFDFTKSMGWAVTHEDWYRFRADFLIAAAIRRTSEGDLKP